MESNGRARVATGWCGSARLGDSYSRSMSRAQPRDASEMSLKVPSANALAWRSTISSSSGSQFRWVYLRLGIASRPPKCRQPTAATPPPSAVSCQPKRAGFWPWASRYAASAASASHVRPSTMYESANNDVRSRLTAPTRWLGRFVHRSSFPDEPTLYERTIGDRGRRLQAVCR